MPNPLQKRKPENLHTRPTAGVTEARHKSPDFPMRKPISLIVVIVLVAGLMPAKPIYAVDDSSIGTATSASATEPTPQDNVAAEPASTGSIEQPTDASVEAAAETPTDTTSEAPTDITSDASVEATTNAATDAATKAATDAAASLEPLDQPETANEPTDPTPGDAAQAPDPAFLKEPTLDDTPEAPDGAVREVSHDRYSKTWANQDGTFTTRIQNDPLTFTDSDGQEKDIDNTLIDEGDSLTNADNSYSIALPKQGGAVTYEKDGYTLSATPLFGTLENAVAKENAIYYNSVADGIDIQYTIHGATVEEDVILSHPSMLKQFDYALSAPGITFVLSNGQVLGFEDGQENDQDAKPVFVIDTPAMTDASGVYSTDIQLALEPSADGVTMTITPDDQWLADPERTWPVVIDPTHDLDSDNLVQGTIQEFAGYSSGPDMEHFNVPYLYAGFEDGSLVGVAGITYGQSWSYIQIVDITPYVEDIPDRAILSAKLSAYKYGTVQGLPGDGLAIDAMMITAPWGGDGRLTWNNRPLPPGGLTYLNTQYTPAGAGWMDFDITDAFKEWKRDPATNRGIMLMPENANQPAVSFSGTGNVHGGRPLYIELSWTVPNAVDENLPITAPNVNLRPLVNKDGNQQTFIGLFADGLVRPTWLVDYQLQEQDQGSFQAVDSGVYAKAEPEPDYPDSDAFGSQLSFTLGYTGLYESNWQSKLFLGSTMFFDTLYRVMATGTSTYDIWVNPNGDYEQTPPGYSDQFIAYQIKDQDTLPYIANYYGVSRNQIALDNRIGDNLCMPGDSFFIRNPNKNATIPYSRPDELTLAQMRSLIYANMGRSQVSEFDMEPVNMNTGNFYLEQTDSSSQVYGSAFDLTRSYNSLAPQSAGPFGRGWSTPFQQMIMAGQDGSITYITEDGRHLVFSPQAGGGWQSPAGYDFGLTRHDASAPDDVSYTITKPDGSTLEFNS
ncbi:MAG: DUF6531 domain-containing protein, partial [Coriobacteriia bacterium]|nr:DUF6531 domain-containing protein [Coriobacteriia bacterium]